MYIKFKNKKFLNKAIFNKRSIIGEHDSDYQYESQSEMLEDLFDYIDKKYYLKFIDNHMEHMDYVRQVEDKLKEIKVKGDITFGSLDGDNAGKNWGYRFDGKGGMKGLTGVLTFVESE